MVPRDLDFPEKFTTFRSVQEEIFEHALTSDKRFIACGAPPGCGKSGVAWGLAKLFGGRTIILTAQKGLQDQYVADGFPGLVDMRGRSNFHCWHGGSCEDGARTGCGDHLGCPYRGRLRLFNDASVGLSNYAWWMSVFAKGQGCELPDTLILDEAHLGMEWLSRSLDFHLGERELRDVGFILNTQPLPGEEIDVWKTQICVLQSHAETALIQAKHKLEGSPAGHALEKARLALKKAEGFLDRVNKMYRLDTENWVCTREDGTDDGRIWRFECIWPYKYRELLFRGVKRVILMSATLRPKTLSLLGISSRDYDFREWGRQFPAANGPVVWVPTARVVHRMTDEDKLRWHQRIFQIVEWGKDRKGLIHTVSYDRARYIASHFNPDKYESYMILNGAADPDSATARQSYERFLKAAPGAVLVSPSFSTGWDFAGRSAEYQIISKIAFPDTRSKVMQARTADDRGYGNYLAAQELVQSSGRIQRFDKDRGQTLLIDDSWSWFKGQASEYLPKWFNVRREEGLPKPLEKL